VKVKPDDPIEAAFILYNQRHWTLSSIAGHLSVSKKTAERYIQLYKNKESRYWAGTRNKKEQPRTYGAETRDLVKHFKEEVPERSENTIEINWDAWISDVEDRKVNTQNIISIEGKKYVLPPGHAGMRVRVRKLEDRFEIYSGDIRIDMILKRPSPSSSSDVVERVIAKTGTFKFKRKTYYVGYQHAGKLVKIQLSATGEDIFVFHDDMLLTRMRIDDGSAY
jgi:hypothetical protein